MNVVKIMRECMKSDMTTEDRLYFQILDMIWKTERLMDELTKTKKILRMSSEELLQENERLWYVDEPVVNLCLNKLIKSIRDINVYDTKLNDVLVLKLENLKDGKTQPPEPKGIVRHAQSG